MKFNKHSLKSSKTILLSLFVLLSACTPIITSQNTNTENTPANVSPQQPSEIDNQPDNNPRTVSAKYQSYLPDSYIQAEGKKRILFFHATWCPTCKQANQDIETNLSQIPEDVVIFKTDYDTETQLKSKYGITYQHTFVLVDDQGNPLKKWNGGGVDKILENI